MKNTTLFLLINENEKKILLGRKKKGFGSGKYNGFGGKPNDNENIEETAIRELDEECGVKVLKDNIEKVGILNFTFKKKKQWNQIVHLFIAKKWENEPKESEEMKPEWFNFNEIPFDKMWQDDRHWLPLVLKGKKIQGSFVFGDDNETILNFNIREEKDVN